VGFFRIHEPTVGSNDKQGSAELFCNSAARVLGSLEELEESVEDFDNENWRDVVPRVRDGITELRNAVEELRIELGYEH
jgi:hypothetical protein